MDKRIEKLLKDYPANTIGHRWLTELAQELAEAAYADKLEAALREARAALRGTVRRLERIDQLLLQETDSPRECPLHEVKAAWQVLDEGIPQR